MPKVTEEHRQAMRERIHRATLEAFRKRGVQGASMADILKESELSAGAIYGYYKSKDELVAAVAGEIVAGRVGMLDSLAEADPIVTPIEAVRVVIASLPAEYVEAALVVQIWAMARHDPEIFGHLNGSFSAIIGGFQRYLTRYATEQGVAADRAELWAGDLAPVLAGLCQAYIVQAALVGRDGAELVLRGLDHLAVPLPAT